MATVAVPQQRHRAVCNGEFRGADELRGSEPAMSPPVAGLVLLQRGWCEQTTGLLMPAAFNNLGQRGDFGILADRR